MVIGIPLTLIVGVEFTIVLAVIYKM